MSPLAAHGLACGHGGKAVVAGLELAVAPGELVAVVGPNGAGKSTLLATLAGLLPPVAGHVTLAGRALTSYTPHELALQRAFMAQGLPEAEGWRVDELVALGRFPHRGWGRGADDRAAVAEALAAVGLAERAGDAMQHLSGGQRQRAYLARALVQATPLLLLDEPTAHLDPGHQVAFFRVLREVMARRELAVVAVLHDLNLAAQFCQRLWVLAPGNPGRLVADGPPGAVLDAELVASVFGLDVQVRHHPESGLPYLLPATARRAGGAAPATGPRLHVIVGGGAGERALPALADMGYRVSVGAVHMLDSDEALAERLGLPAVVEAPFCPLGPATLAQLDATLAAAEVVVVADVAWGSGNVANLRALAALPALPPTYLVADTPLDRRDFTDGEATALWQALLARGAREATLEEVLAALRQEDNRP